MAKSKEFISISSEDKEILRFLEQVRSLGSAVVQLGSERFIVNIRREVITDEGRSFLARGGPLDDPAI